jgi:Cupin-like domain
MPACQACLDVQRHALELASRVHDFEHYDRVAELDSTPDSLEFERTFVSRNRPCVIRGAVSHWPAIQKWNLDYIAEHMGDAEATCTFTGDGRADSVQSAAHGDVFMLPDNREMPMRRFASLLRRSRESGATFVPTVQYQNGNLSEFAPLKDDIDVDFQWALRAFGCGTPDAVNLWIGDARSSTTFHKARTLLAPSTAPPHQRAARHSGALACAAEQGQRSGAHACAACKAKPWLPTARTCTW